VSPVSERLAYPLTITSTVERPLTITVDGRRLAVTYPNSSVAMDPATLPALPFEVSVTFASGRFVGAGMAEGPAAFLLRLGTTCGVIDIWSAAPRDQPHGPRPDPRNDVSC
jgi:hypothetical protein